MVIGNGEFALNEAKELSKLVKNLKILTNGLDLVTTTDFEYDNRKIKKIHGTTNVEKIEFEDGEFLEVDGIFIAQGIAGGNDFAKKLGIITKDEKIVVNEKMETNINGIFACGDIAGGIYQINKAVYEGAIAGLNVVEYIKK